MTQRATSELNAAGIWDPYLRDDYAHSRRLAAAHGRTYFLATRFLAAEHRPAVHALYGFARTADDIVDDPDPSVSPGTRGYRLQQFSNSLGTSAQRDPTVRAVLHTAQRYGLSEKLFEAFLASMRMDLTVAEYESFADLERYVYGSAAVIGLMVTPILGTVGSTNEAAPFAGDLGIAFQLTNFIRDVGEDAHLGRVYLPQQSLREFGVTREDLLRGVVDDRMRRLLAHEIARARGFYEKAEPGIAMLQPRARACVAVAFELYHEILTEIEKADYQIFGQRIRVSRRRRAQVAAKTLLRTVLSRPRSGQRRGQTTDRRPSHTHVDRVSATNPNPNPMSSTGA